MNFYNKNTYYYLFLIKNPFNFYCNSLHVFTVASAIQVHSKWVAGVFDRAEETFPDRKWP